MDGNKNKMQIIAVILVALSFIFPIVLTAIFSYISSRVPLVEMLLTAACAVAVLATKKYARINLALSLLAGVATLLLTIVSDLNYNTGVGVGSFVKSVDSLIQTSFSVVNHYPMILVTVVASVGAIVGGIMLIIVGFKKMAEIRNK